MEVKSRRSRENPRAHLKSGGAEVNGLCTSVDGFWEKIEHESYNGGGKARDTASPAPATPASSTLPLNYKMSQPNQSINQDSSIIPGDAFKQNYEQK